MSLVALINVVFLLRLELVGRSTSNRENPTLLKYMSASLLAVGDKIRNSVRGRKQSAQRVEIKDEPAPPPLFTRVEDKEGFWARIKKMRSWESYICLTFLGTIFLVMPAAILMSLFPDSRPTLNQQDPEILQQVAGQIIRVSLYLTSVWIIWLFFWFIIQIMPRLVTRVIVFNYGYCSELVIQRLDYLPVIHFNLTSAATMILSTALFAVIFAQYQIVPVWQSVFNVIIMCMIFSLMLLIQRICVQKIAFGFHRVAYDERLSKSKKEINILESLRKAVKKMGVLDLITDINGTKNQNQDDDDIESSPDRDRNSFPHSKLFPPRYRRKGKASEEATPELEIVVESNLEGSIKSNKVEKEEKDKDKKEEEPQKLNFLRIGGIKKKKRNLEVSGEHEAKKLSHRLFEVLRRGHTSEVQITSFYPYFTSHAEAKDAFELFDTDKNGKVDEAEMRSAVTRIYKEKRNLNHSLNDISHALGQLNAIMYGFSIILTFLLGLPVYNIQLTAILPFTSLLLALSFIFGNSAKSTFDSVIFLFAIHPFDSGDRVIIEEKGYIVEELQLLTTVLRTDGKLLYMPNSFLIGKVITNIRRSGDQTDYCRLTIDCFTSEVVMQLLHDKMVEFCKNQPRLLRPSVGMDLVEIGPANLMTYQFSIDHRGNWQDAQKKGKIRTLFMHTIKANMQELEIKFKLPLKEEGRLYHQIT